MVEPTGPVSYRCKLQDGEMVRKHVDQVRSRHVPYEQTERDPFPEVLDTQENQEQPESNSPVENDKHTQRNQMIGCIQKGRDKQNFSREVFIIWARIMP